MANPLAPCTRYQYSNLESDQIRLLRVVSTGDSIHCHIEHVSLHDAPVYHALSYVWGDGEQDVKIILTDTFGEGSFHITAHLARFLNRVYEHQDEFIWIDAICINQGDLSEKATQIPLMRSIYRNAAMVCIWLGEPSRDALTSMTILQWLKSRDQIKTHPGEQNDKVLELLKNLEDVLNEVGVERVDLLGLLNVLDVLATHPSDDIFALKDHIESLSSERPILRRDHSIWSALLTFFLHPWFSRIWTLQEIYLAQEACVMIGPFAIPWEYYSKVRSLLLSARCLQSVYSEKNAKTAGFGNIMLHTLEMQTSSRLDGQSLRLDVLLCGLTMRHARVEKDYIYGILGILDDNVRQRMPIDYSTSTSTATVYAQATRVACEIAKDPTSYWSALMAFYGNRKRKIDGLPSWCPDFCNTGKEDDVLTYESGPEISETVSETYKPYAWMEFPDTTNTLVVSGFRLDVVEEVIPAPDILSFTEMHTFVDRNTDFDLSTFCKAFGAKQLKWLNDMESAFAPRGNSNAISTGWLHRFLFNNLSDEKFEEHARGLSLVKIFCALMVANNITSPTTAGAMLEMSAAERREMLRSIAPILYHQCGRHVFRTSSGRLGYAPVPVSPGDSICFLPDGELLHVLSPDCTRHVALAHVEGFMGDDLLKIVPTDKSQWEEFHLS